MSSEVSLPRSIISQISQIVDNGRQLKVSCTLPCAAESGTTTKAKPLLADADSEREGTTIQNSFPNFTSSTQLSSEQEFMMLLLIDGGIILNNDVYHTRRLIESHNSYLPSSYRRKWLSPEASNYTVLFPVAESPTPTMWLKGTFALAFSGLSSDAVQARHFLSYLGTYTAFIPIPAKR